MYLPLVQLPEPAHKLHVAYTQRRQALKSMLGFFLPWPSTWLLQEFPLQIYNFFIVGIEV